ncbi:hypothetical protein ACFT4A_18920 [Streptomyces sp. NPDC057099]|uniref:hypothetical protein n=1 Tax=Streptomyces sp. NPDC057099 TaxID=3346019 RepID=UPI00362A56E2
MTINQPGWQFHGNARIYTIAGDLHLTEASGPQEFTEVLGELRSRIRELEGVPTEELAQVDTELAQVVDAAGDGDGDADEDGDGDVVAGRLTRIADRLRALGGSANAVAEAGNSLDQLAQWAGTHF